jgi:FkbM family methyltransferase
VSFVLRIKARLVGSPLEAAAIRIRWLLGSFRRYRYPELWEFYFAERLLPQFLKTVLGPESNVVDVGSHVGSFISLAMKFAPNGKHTLFEPTPSKCEILRVKFHKATVHQVAVSNISGTATFEENLKQSGVSRLQGTNASTDTVSRYQVVVSRLDDMLSDRVDLLKLDVIGNELAALRGATQTIIRYRPTILFGCGSEDALNQIGASRSALYNFLTAELNYAIFTFIDYLYKKPEMSFIEFEKCGMYPFRAVYFIAIPRS